MVARLYFLLYSATALINVGSNLFSFEAIAMCSKVLLMPLLIIYVYTITKKNITSVIFLLLSALFFSWTGDISLLFDSNTCFLMGMGFFLLAQLLYACLFIKSTPSAIQWQWWYIVPMLLITFAIMSQLLPMAGALQIPVGIYGLAISIMAIAAIARQGSVHRQSFWLVFIGASSFVVSDSSIAFNRFVTPSVWGNGFVMLTYTVAQALIVLGILYTYRNNGNKITTE